MLKIKDWHNENNIKPIDLDDEEIELSDLNLKDTPPTFIADEAWINPRFIICIERVREFPDKFIVTLLEDQQFLVDESDFERIIKQTKSITDFILDNEDNPQEDKYDPIRQE